jgi:hypothetical protein
MRLPRSVRHTAWVRSIDWVISAIPFRLYIHIHGRQHVQSPGWSGQTEDEHEADGQDLARGTHRVSIADDPTVS